MKPRAQELIGSSEAHGPVGLSGCSASGDVEKLPPCVAKRRSGQHSDQDPDQQDALVAPCVVSARLIVSWAMCPASEGSALRTQEIIHAPRKERRESVCAAEGQFCDIIQLRKQTKPRIGIVIGRAGCKIKAIQVRNLST